MLSFGMAVIGSFDGHRFSPQPPRSQTFYRELQPISDRFDEQATGVAGLDREQLARHGTPPAEAMDDAHAWVEDVAGDARAVFVSWPLPYDWLFLQWYFLRYAERGSPFGFASAVDMKTLYWRHAETVLDRAGLDDLPVELQTDAPHTHNALDDAVRASELFVRLWVKSRPAG
jgi:DNA polymerase III epsilon subunit-like protein